MGVLPLLREPIAMNRYLILTPVVFLTSLGSVGKAADSDMAQAERPSFSVEIPSAPDQEGVPLGHIDGFKKYAFNHPNELWRMYALEAVHLGRTSAAAEYFERAALYADKFSQHRLSLLYWNGAGVDRDRAKAYAWADLAAERGFRDLLIIRETMWSELSSSERAAVSAVGPEMFARYGDAVAKPRLEKRLKYGLVHATGSRTGFEIDRIVIIEKPGADFIRGKFWDRERWVPGEYWKGVDAAFSGTVVVEPLIRESELVPEQDP